MKKNLYDVLGVEKGSKTLKDDLKRSYRRKAKENHPDKGGDPAEFNQISIAYRVLSDDQSRERYDQTGRWDTTEPQIYNICIERIDKVFMQLLQERRGGIENTDWIGDIRAIFENGKNKATAATKQIEGDIPFLERIAANTVHTGNERNLFAMIMEDKIQIARAQIEANRKEIGIYEKCLEILQGYSLKNIPGKATFVYYHSGMGFSSTTI